MSYTPGDEFDYTRVSTCCGATMLADIDRCSDCKEWNEGELTNCPTCGDDLEEGKCEPCAKVFAPQIESAPYEPSLKRFFSDVTTKEALVVAWFVFAFFVGLAAFGK